MISLFAFLLVLGIVVDDAIVVGENIAQTSAAEGVPARCSRRCAAAREVRVTRCSRRWLTTIVAFSADAVLGAGLRRAGLARDPVWSCMPVLVHEPGRVADVPALAPDPDEEPTTRTARPWLGSRACSASVPEHRRRARLELDRRASSISPVRRCCACAGATRRSPRPPRCCSWSSTAMRRGRLPAVRVLPDGRGRQHRHLADDAGGHADVERTTDRCWRSIEKRRARRHRRDTTAEYRQRRHRSPAHRWRPSARSRTRDREQAQNQAATDDRAVPVGFAHLGELNLAAAAVRTARGRRPTQIMSTHARARRRRCPTRPS